MILSLKLWVRSQHHRADVFSRSATPAKFKANAAFRIIVQVNRHGGLMLPIQRYERRYSGKNRLVCEMDIARASTPLSAGTGKIVSSRIDDIMKVWKKDAD